MNTKEKLEHQKLSFLWATGKASKKQILRCMELDSKARTLLAGEGT